MFVFPLDGAGWRFVPDPFWEGESLGWHAPDHPADTWLEVAVPTVFDRCHADLRGYEGMGWFRREFVLPRDMPGDLELYFGAVNYRATVYLNGERLGENRDGFLPFTLPVPPERLLPGRRNVLVVIADNTRRAGDVPGRERGWRPFGGILREVTLREPSPSWLIPRDMPRVAVENGSLTINGTPTLLLGFNRHEDSPRTDAATDTATARQDLLRMKNAGANFVRLCHYPHDPTTLDLCDEIGLWVMAEIPLYWWKGNADGEAVYAQTLETAKRQLRAMIERDRHHPSIIAWCVSNETEESRPEVVTGNDELVRYAKSLDPSRLAVHVSNRWTEHPHFDADDVICVNGYPYMSGRGWGDGTAPDAAGSGDWWRDRLRELHARYPDKPILVSEFGHVGFAGVAEGSAGETAQAGILQAQLRGILSAGPFVCGAAVWCWADHAWAEDDWFCHVHTSPFGVVTRDRRAKAALAVLESAFRRAESSPSLFLRRPNLNDLPPLDLPDGYTLRAATDTDADAMAEMLAGAFPEMTWTVGNVRDWLLNDDSVKTTFVIDREGVPVATASARIVPDAYPGSGYVHWVGTAPGHRGKRLGLLVSLATLYEFVRLGCADAVLETDDFRVPAIKVYLTLGFRPEYHHATHAPRWAALAPALKEYL